MNKDKPMVNVLDVWETDFGDYRALVNLSYVQKKPLGNVTISYSKDNIYELVEHPVYDCNSDEVKQVFKKLVENDLEKYTNLPKLSNCSKLLREIYKNVSESDATMCHITEEEWDNYYAKDFTDSDFDILRNEVNKLGLEEVITFDDFDYKIIGWGDLETRLLDDSKVTKEINEEIDMEVEMI